MEPEKNIDTEAGGEPKPRETRSGWRQALCWASYDFANSGYSMIVLALVFPRFYRAYFADGLSEAEQTRWFGLTVAAAGLLVALTAPFLGTLGTLLGHRRQLLVRFAGVSMLACVSLSLLSRGDWWLASVIHVVGMACYYSSNLFYDALLDRVSHRANRNLVSALGSALGYVAGLLLIFVIIWFNTAPYPFGLPDADAANRWLFVIAAVWWGVFTIPLAVGLRDPACEVATPRPLTEPAPAQRLSVAALLSKGQHLIGAARSLLRRTWAEVVSTFRDIVAIPSVRYFLIAYLFYIDGVNTITISAANLAEAMQFPFSETVMAFLVVQVVAVPCSLLFGWLANRFGARNLLVVAMGIYLITTLYGANIGREPLVILGASFSPMLGLAVLIGAVIGGVQSLSRSFFANLIPPEKSTAFFGFYSMIGKSAAIFGPLIIAVCAGLFNDPADPVASTRLGFGAVGILFVLGAWFLLKVKPARPSAEPPPAP